MKKNFKITQAASGNYITWVSQGAVSSAEKLKLHAERLKRSL